MSGIELCELTRSDGMLYPVNLISFFQAGVLSPALRPLLAGNVDSEFQKAEDPCFICFITLVEKTNEYVCHCFLASSADLVRRIVEQAVVFSKAWSGLLAMTD